MKRNDKSIAAYPGGNNYVPGTPYPEVEPQRHTVVSADNTASPVQVLALAFFVLFVVAASFAWAVRDLTGWSLSAVALIVLPAIAALGFILFLAANGDWLAWREIVRNSKNQETAILEHADLLRTSEDHRHIEEMRRLGIQETQVNVDGQLKAITMHIEGIERRMLTVTESPAVVSPAKFVEADPIHAAAKTTAINFAVSLYDRPGNGGAPHPSRILLEGKQPGRIRGETPFSKRGRWGDGVKTEIGARAAQMLLKPNNGAAPVIVEVPGGYALNIDAYPTRQMVWQKFA